MLCMGSSELEKVRNKLAFFVLFTSTLYLPCELSETLRDSSL